MLLAEKTSWAYARHSSGNRYGLKRKCTKCLTSSGAGATQRYKDTEIQRYKISSSYQKTKQAINKTVNQVC